MSGLLSFYTSLGFIAVFAVMQVWIVFYTWYLRRRETVYEDLLAKYSAELDSILAEGTEAVPVRFFTGQISVKQETRLLRDYLKTRIISAPHREEARLKTYADTCGLTAVLRKEARSAGRWKKAIALRLLAVVCDRSDAGTFKTTLFGSNFKPAMLAAAIGLANCDERPDIRLFIGRLYNKERPNRDEILALLSHYYRSSASQCIDLLRDETLPLALRTTLMDFLGVSRMKAAASVLEEIVANNSNAEVLVHALEALEKTGNAESCRRILPCLANDDFRVRIKAVSALERLSGGAHIGEIEKMLSDLNVFVRRNAAEAMSRMGDGGMKRLQSMVASEDRDVSRTARMILAEKKYDKIRWRYRYGDSIP